MPMSERIEVRCDNYACQKEEVLDSEDEMVIEGWVQLLFPNIDYDPEEDNDDDQMTRKYFCQLSCVVEFIEMEP